MPNNQNPVFTDNDTILGDGTEENPLHAESGGGAPGGVEGDAQFNNGAGGFAAAQELFAGFTFSIAGGNLIIAAPAGKFISIIAGNGGGGIVIDGSGAGDPVHICRDFNSGDVILGNSVNLLQILAGVPVFANNAAAIGGGLAVGNVYRTGADPDFLAIVH